MRTSIKAAVIGSVLLALGLALFVYAEGERVTSPIQFSYGGKVWNVAHYLSLALFTVSTAFYVLWYLLKETEDRE